jgi:hypothetical protein
MRRSQLDSKKDAHGKYSLWESPHGHYAPSATGSIKLGVVLDVSNSGFTGQSMRAEQHV